MEILFSISLLIFTSFNAVWKQQEKQVMLVLYFKCFSCLIFLANIFFLSQLKEYKIIGRPLPKEKQNNPPLYRMRIFAPDKVTAKSRFWYFTRKLKKLKKSNGEIVSISEVSNFFFQFEIYSKLFFKNITQLFANLHVY